MKNPGSTPISLDRDTIYAIQKNRPPLLMVDRATDLYPMKEVVGYRSYVPEEWFFECHWPGDPNVPGALQLESMFQTASLAILCLSEFSGKAMYLYKLEDAYFKMKICPGTHTKIFALINSFRHGIAKCSAKIVDEEGAVFSHAKFSLVIPTKITGRISSS